jgi:hypothetical protein
MPRIRWGGKGGRAERTHSSKMAENQVDDTTSG